MSYDLYYAAPSAPCRAVLMVAKELDIELNLKTLNLMEKEHLTPEFLAINPQHTIPTLVDNEEDGFAVWESRAILKYLVDKVSPGHSLYPTELKTRATINRWLDFDLGSYYPSMAPVLYPVFLYGQPLDESKVPALKEKLKIVDDALEGKEFLVTESYTLADISLLVNITTLEVLEDILDVSEFENISKWKENLRNVLPYYQEINESGLEFIRNWIKSKETIA